MSSEGGAIFSSNEEWLCSMLSKYADNGTEIKCNGNRFEASNISNHIRRVCMRDGGTHTEVSITGAVFLGEFDLERVSAQLKLRFEDCHFENTDSICMNMRSTQFDAFQSDNCSFNGNVSFDYASTAQHIVVRGTRNDRRHWLNGTLRLHWAQVGGNVDVQNMAISSPIAMLGTKCQVKGNFTIENTDCNGDIDFTFCEINGRTNIRRCALRGNLELNKSAFRDVSFLTDVNCAKLLLEGSKFFERFTVVDCNITQGFNGFGLTSDRGISFNRVSYVEAEDASFNRSTSLKPADAPEQLPGYFLLSEATCDGSVTIRSCIGWRSMQLSRMRMKGNLAVASVRLANPRGVALDASRITTEGEISLLACHIAGGTRLQGCNCGELSLRGSVFSGLDDAAIVGFSLVVQGRINARECQSIGCIILDGSKIGGTLELGESKLSCSRVDDSIGSFGLSKFRAFSLSLADCNIGRVEFSRGADDTPAGNVDFRRATISTIRDHLHNWPQPRHGHYVFLDGLEYKHLDNALGDVPNHKNGRLLWLKSQDPESLGKEFKPQPWRQAVYVLRDQGYLNESIETAIEAERLRLSSGRATRFDRIVGTLLWLFADFGYRPWKTVVWSAGLVLLFATVWWMAFQLCGDGSCSGEDVFIQVKKGDFFTLNQRLEDAHYRADYPEFIPLVYSMDLFAPGVDFGSRANWVPNWRYSKSVTIKIQPSLLDFELIEIKPFARLPEEFEMRIGVGAILVALHSLEIVLGIVFTALMVTGFSGHLRPGDD